MIPVQLLEAAVVVNFLMMISFCACCFALFSHVPKRNNELTAEYTGLTRGDVDRIVEKWGFWPDEVWRKMGKPRLTALMEATPTTKERAKERERIVRAIIEFAGK